MPPPASSDKTVSTWDPRSGLSVQTYYGHRNSVTGVAYTMAGGTIASTDAGARLALPAGGPSQHHLAWDSSPSKPLPAGLFCVPGAKSCDASNCIVI
jgi:WD40 repeat protein